jgi:alpha,alpha-trehalase
MYYWDSFFISLGLVGTPYAHLIADVAENFAALIERFGVIPNGTRYYFLSRSQPPFFTEQIKLARAVAPPTSEVASPAWLARMLGLAEREHETVWLGTAQPHHRLVHRGLSRYFDINYLDVLASCESGWDHSTRCDDRWLRAPARRPQQHPVCPRARPGRFRRAAARPARSAGAPGRPSGRATISN